MQQAEHIEEPIRFVHSKRGDSSSSFYMAQMSPPNPILDPSLKLGNENNVGLTLAFQSTRTIPSPRKQAQTQSVNHFLKSRTNESSNSANSLMDCYYGMTPVYQRFDNQKINNLGAHTYMSSIFINPKQFEASTSKKQEVKIQPLFQRFAQPEQKKMQQQQQASINPKSKSPVLQFDSRFESGNLFAAYHVSADQYDLVLQNDINTKGNTQWFYFSATGGRKNQTVKFNIVNLYKSSSLYQQGMKPLVYSTTANKGSSIGIGWHRYGSSITYYPSQVAMEGKPNRCYSVFSFSYKFDYDNDLVYFSHCFPYTYTYLRNYLKTMSDNCPPEILTIRTVGKTVLKYPIPMLSIGQNIRQSERKLLINKPSTTTRDGKQAIVVLARQHPGQSQGSLLCEGFVNQLMNNLDSYETKFLLSHYNFYVFPMVNIDGVVNGNYRSNIYGYDLNRVWNLDKSDKHPQVGAIKAEISRISKAIPIALVIDFHGHSKKLNSFFFGNPGPKNIEGSPHKLLALLASKISPYVSFRDCTFIRQQERAGVARIAIQDLIQPKNSECEVFTFQASFYGTIRNNKKVHFTQEDYKKIGADLLSTVFKRYSEVVKERKTNKESVLLKDLRKELSTVPKWTEDKAGSDSEIERVMGSDAHFPDEQLVEKLRLKDEQKEVEMQSPAPSFIPKTNKFDRVYIPLRGETVSCQTDFEKTEANTTVSLGATVSSLIPHNASTLTLEQIQEPEEKAIPPHKQPSWWSSNYHSNVIPYPVNRPRHISNFFRNEAIIERRKTQLLGSSSRQNAEAEFKETYMMKLNLIRKLKVSGEKCEDIKEFKGFAREGVVKFGKGTQTESSYLRDYYRAKQLGYHKTTRLTLLNRMQENNSLDSKKRKEREDQSSQKQGRKRSLREASFNITQQVTQMIKVRRIKYRAKAASSYFRQEFILSQQDQPQMVNKMRLPVL